MASWGWVEGLDDLGVGIRRELLAFSSKERQAVSLELVVKRCLGGFRITTSGGTDDLVLD